MSTRCNVEIIDGRKTRYLYHHADGYPLFMAPKLEAFITYIRDSRPDLNDADGWAEAMSDLSRINYSLPREPDAVDLTEEEIEFGKYRQSRPTFEHTDGIHGDIEFLWRISLDLDARLTCYKVKPFTDDPPKKINYLVAWKAELERSIAYVEERRQEAESTSDLDHARELQERIDELRCEHEELTNRTKNKRRK